LKLPQWQRKQLPGSGLKKSYFAQEKRKAEMEAYAARGIEMKYEVVSRVFA